MMLATIAAAHSPIAPQKTKTATLTPVVLKSPKSRPKASQAIRDAKEIQLLMLEDMRKKSTKAAVRASLARSWVMVQSIIQELRGIPKPGQLRPDLDPHQMMKALKRAKTRGALLDIAGGFANEAPTEEPPAEKQSAKESLSAGQGVTTGGGGGGAEK